MKARNKVMSISLAVSAIAALVVALHPAPTFALEADRVTAKIPFSFVAGDKTYPAGEYQFLANDPVNPRLVTIESENGSRTGLALAESSGNTAIPVASSEVTFDQFGNRYFLSKIFISGNDAALQIPKSEIQLELERAGQQSVKVRVPATKPEH